MLEEKYCKLIHLKPYSDDNGLADKGLGPLPQEQKYIKQITEITDEEGLRLAYETKDG